MANEDSTVVSGKVYGYLRVSHIDSVNSGNGIDVQKTSVAAFADRLLEKHPELTWAQWFQDDAESAYKVELAARKEGRKLVLAVQPGDHVIFSRLDRGFRQMRDLTRTVHLWGMRGVNFHFADHSFDTATPGGKMMLHILGSYAEYEAAMCSLRVRETNAQLRRAGRPPAGMAPLGFKWHSSGKGKRKTLAVCKDARRVMQEIVRLRDEGMAWEKMSLHINRTLQKHEGVHARGWGVETCRRAYKSELALQARERQVAARNEQQRRILNGEDAV